jgi:hypothetical protein
MLYCIHPRITGIMHYVRSPDTRLRKLKKETDPFLKRFVSYLFRIPNYIKFHNAAILRIMLQLIEISDY